MLEQIEAQITDLAAQLVLIQTAQDTADASMPDIPDVTITADSSGTVHAGQLPRNVAAKRFDGATNVTATSTWSFTVDSGSITATIGAATGVLNITALGSTSVVTITSVHNSITKSRKVTIIKSIAAPSSGGGGGTSATDTAFASFNSTTHAAVSDELTVTVGSAGEVALSAPLSVYTAEEAPAGTFEVFGIWQWFDGAAWVDRGVEVASDPDARVVFDAEQSIYFASAGTLSVSHTHTGLVAGSSHKYRLMARNAAGTRIMYLSGTASAVGS